MKSKNPSLMEKEEAAKERVRGAVKEILENADVDSTTEKMVRSEAAEKAGVELSTPWLKKLVKDMVDEFMKKSAPEPEKKKNKIEHGSSAANQSSSEGDHLICQLSAKRNVSVQNFKGKALVSIREYYQKDGKTLPSNKGISLTVDQWDALKKGLPAIEQAIKSLQ